MRYHPYENDSKNVITDYEVAKLKHLTEAINQMCWDLEINVKEFATLLLEHSTTHDAYNAYSKILEYASKKVACYAPDDWGMVTFEPEDCQFAAYSSQFDIDPVPYLKSIVERIKEEKK